MDYSGLEGVVAEMLDGGLFRSIIDAVPNAVIVVDSRRIVRGANRHAISLFGASSDVLIGELVERLLPERFRAGHPGLVESFFQAPVARPMGHGRELFARKFDGAEFPVEIGLSPLLLDGQSYVLASVVDITERKRFQDARERLSAIVQSSDDAIIAKSPDGRIVSWNAAAERLFGFSEAEAIGQSIYLIVPEQAREDEEYLLSQVRAGERVEHFVTSRRRKDGGLVDVSVSLSPLRDIAGKFAGTSSIIRDHTEAKRRDSELLRSNAELEQFAYVASHDLQEPLRMVANFVELLGDRYRGQLDDRAEKYITYASEGARRMQRLISDLLAYSRVGSQSKDPKPVDANAVLEKVTRSMRQLIVEQAAEVISDPLPTIFVDEIQLGQIFQNLISNAIKFRSETPPLIRIAAERKGKDWEFSVADNGIGLDMQFSGRIFQMFQRLQGDRRQEGSGIGLAIAQRAVEHHGGKIWVESSPGQGAIFRFTLPAISGE